MTRDIHAGAGVNERPHLRSTAGVCLFARHASHVARLASHLSPHTSYITPLTSHLIHHTSYITPHISHVTQWILDSIVARKRLGEVNAQCKLHAANIKACAAKYEQQTTNSNHNPKPRTPNPNPQTPNPKPQTPNPKQAAYTVVNRGQSLVGRL